MTDFTPVSALAGGALIGLSAIFLMAANGRIAGISGIAGGLIASPVGDRLWRLAFIAGLVLGPLVVIALGGAALPFALDRSTGLIIAGGLLVGVGTRLGSGCTSGHGVCGISRVSPRSIAATATFMATGIATVAALRSIWGIGV